LISSASVLSGGWGIVIHVDLPLALIGDSLRRPTSKGLHQRHVFDGFGAVVD
jgi:hypothetical protein